jgi:two-component system, cell cycle sensor histidine kinase and response regulator CckA
MEIISFLFKPFKLWGPGAKGKSTDRPKRHCCIFVALLLLLYLGTLLQILPAQLVILIALFSLILCHFVYALCYQRNDRRLEAIFEASPNPIVVYNKQGHPQRLNPAFTRIFGWTLEELHGRCIPFIPESERPITGQKLEEMFRTGRPVTFETLRLTKAGDVRNVIVSAAIALGRNYTSREMVVNITDITERKQFEDRLQQAQKMQAMGTLAGGIAHDFNNLLTPLMGYAEMLTDDLPADSPAQEKAAEIFSAGSRAKELVNQILAFSRRSDTKPEPMKLQPFINETLKLLRASIPSNIKILQEIDMNCGPVMANPAQIHQVLMNLAANAFHAMEGTGGMLSVTLRQAFVTAESARSGGPPPGKYAHLVVADTGIGIEKQTLAKIFDPYFTTKDKSKGTGLGLAVVQGVVNSVGGVIRVFSEAGRGSEFHVYWPLSRGEKMAAMVRPKAPIPGGTEKILLVDDEATVMKMVRQMLERLGYQVAAYTSGIEALAAFKADPENIDLVLTDMTMPEITGDLLAREAMTIRPAIPVIVSTGYSKTLTSEVAEKIGIKGVINKPASKSSLAVAIRKALDDAAACAPLHQSQGTGQIGSSLSTVG